MQTTLSPQEVAQRGRALYTQQLKEKVEPEHQGEFLMLDILSGGYEIDADDIAAEERLFTRHSDAIVYQMRIGSAAAYFMGSDVLHRRKQQSEDLEAATAAYYKAQSDTERAEDDDWATLAGHVAPQLWPEK